VDALPQLVVRRTGRLHTSFNQAVAATGRLSSSDPNLQNIPIRTGQGAELRKGFIPTTGSASSPPTTPRSSSASSPTSPATHLRRGVPQRCRHPPQTAALVFGVEVADVTPEMRDAAKTINFATIYGIGPFALSKQLGTTVQEAKTFIDNYFERLPGRRYLDRADREGYEDGYVETSSGAGATSPR
jgi:DNA polymerase I